MNEEIETEESEELIFKRFPAEKQDQVRGLVNYATLMGLNGKDLISIGGKLDRIQLKREILRNRDIVMSMADNISTVGKDSDCRRRWVYNFNGAKYYFDDAGYYDVRIRSAATKTVKTFNLYSDYEIGRWSYRGNRHLPSIMLQVYHGEIKLNF